MAQFDVYKNSNKNTHGAYPYIVDIQSPLISELATRIVIPLGNISHSLKIMETELSEVVIFSP